MINVLFFASIREELKTDRLLITFDETVSTVEQLIASLALSNDESWLQVLSADNVIKAVNQQVVNAHHEIKEGDEVAFFPPVTGG